MKTRRFVQYMAPVGQRLSGAFARLRTGLAVFVYLMLGMSPAMADDIDIYIKNVATGGGGAPVIIFQIDSSGSMAWNDYDNDDASSLLRQRMFQVKDATRSQFTGLSGRFNVGLFRYNAPSGLKLADAIPLNTILSTTTGSTGSITKAITDGSNDVAQEVGSTVVRFGDGEHRMSTLERPPNWQQVSIPYYGNWTNSGGQVYNDTASSVGNKVFWYKHTSNSVTSQTITLDSTGAPTVDTYLYFLDDDGDIIASNDDRAPDGYSCPSGWTLDNSTSPPRCSRYCANKDVGKWTPCTSANKNKWLYQTATYVPGNLNSTVNVSGLVKDRWYKVVAATYSPNQSGNFTLNFSNPTRGQLWSEISGPTTVEQHIGLRFTGLEIPKGVNITKAYIEFYADGDTNGATQLAAGVDTDVTPDDFVTRDLFTRTIEWGPFESMDQWSDNERGSDTRIDVEDLMENQVGRTGWCGGDVVFMIKGSGLGTDLRIAESYEGSSTYAPRLVVEWDGTPDADACFTKDITLDIKSISEDVAQATDGTVSFNGISLPVSSTQKAGLRFSLVPLPSGVKIESAYLEVVAHANVTTPRPLYINAIDQPIAKPFQSTVGALDALPLVGETVTWTPSGWVAGSRYTSPDLKNLIQPLVDNAGWEYHGTLGFVISGGNASPMNIRAWERHQSGDTSKSTNVSDYGQFSARLKLRVSSTGGAIPVYNTHRSDIVAKLLAINATGGTPITGTFLEVSQYLLGKDGYTMPDLAEGECATNATIILTDGDETGNYDSTDVASDTEDITEKDCSPSSEEGKWNCTYDLMDALYNGTTAAADGKTYSIRSYAVGFGPVVSDGSGYLPGADSHGGGKYYAATNGAALVNAFTEIVSTAIEGGSTIAAPGVAVNALNKFEHLDELYYSLFKPTSLVGWKGNAKRYRLGNFQIQDIDRNAAIDPATGRFANTAQSWWSDMVDGVVVTLGGVSGEVKAPASRKLFTYLGSYGASMNAPLSPASGPDRDGVGAEIVHVDNLNITQEMMGVPKLDGYDAMSGTQIQGKRSEVITWLRGGVNASPRYEFGSTIHGSPTLVNYGVDLSGHQVNTIFFSDNEGVLHMADTGGPNTNPANATQDRANTGGQELFAFIPQELLPNAAPLNANKQSVLTGDYIYGLDASWVAWKNDIDGDDIIEPAGGDTVHLYGGMRRGGKNYFAFDVTKVNRTSTAEPILRWVIEGGKTGTPYANMGQSWAEPVVRTVKWGGTDRRVVFLSGGYDPASHDNKPTFTDGNQLGRQVYIVDALTGQLLWWASSESSANTVVPEMKYSITAAPVVMDRNGDGAIDGMYVADLAGQLFRFDFNLDANSAGTLVRGNAPVLVARLGATATGANATSDNRRFYDPPAVAYIRASGGGDLMIGLVSGYREEPGTKSTDEKVFVVYDRGAWNLAPPNSPLYPLEPAELVSIAADGSSPAYANGAPGWHMPLQKSNGEKGTGTPLFFNFAMLFTTYVPDGVATDLQCAPDIGYSRLYVINSLTAAGKINATEKFVDQTVPGLGADPMILHTGDDWTVVAGTYTVDATALGLEPPDNTIQRAMWYEVNQ